ncbi:MAG: glycosyltransferase family 39 protein [Planctomycetia bacterium]|nr:MAG: glycosyltransferase family 39 protein [Planctomycetia bacterium]
MSGPPTAPQTAPPDSPAPPASGARDLPHALSPTGTGWFALLMLLTLALGASQWRSTAGFEPIDCWVAQTAREMYEGGDWRSYVIPTFSSETRMQKSPGPYWVVCLTAWLRGGVLDETTVRIPNTFWTMLLVGSVFWLARHVGGLRAAVFSGFVAATCGAVLYWSGRGASDLGVTALMTLSLSAFWIGAERATGARQGRLWLLAWFAAGLAMLYKMPMPLVCVALPAAAYVVLLRRWRLVLSRWHLLGLLLFLLPWLPWAIATVQIEPTALHKWRVEYWDRATGDLPNVDDQRRWYWHFFYFGVALAFCAPYFVSLPGAIVRALRPRGDFAPRSAAFLLIWAGVLFAFFTAAAGKETRYFLPALPPLLVLLGVELAAYFDPRRKPAPQRDRAVLGAVSVLAPLVAAAGAVGLWVVRSRGLDDGVGELRSILLGYGLAAALFCAGAIGCAWLHARRREHLAFGLLTLGTASAWVAAAALLLPLINSQAPFRDFAGQLATRLDADQQSALRQVAQQDSRVIWYSNVRYPRVIDQLDLLEMQGGTRSREREIELIGAAMIERLESEPLALFVATPIDYLLFFTRAPLELARRGREMPPTHVWIVSRAGRWDHRYIVFGNRPPPWPAPAPAFPEKFANKLDEVRASARDLLTTATREPESDTPAAAGPPATAGAE